MTLYGAASPAPAAKRTHKKGREASRPSSTAVQQKLLAGWAQRWEQNHVADGVAVGKQHHHTVDTNA